MKNILFVIILLFSSFGAEPFSAGTGDPVLSPAEATSRYAAVPDVIPPGEDASDTASRSDVFVASDIGDDVFKRIEGVSWKPGCPAEIEDLRLLTITHVDFEGRSRTGELICHKNAAGDLLDIFRELYEMGFPIDKIKLIDEYGADDLLSMEDNNTSAFNYRTVSGTANLSRHAYGLAVDINPVQNPYTEDGGEYVSPESGRAYLNRSDARPGMITRGDAVYNAFVSRGWFWGGDWKYQIDYQHFQMDLPK